MSGDGHHFERDEGVNCKPLEKRPTVPFADRRDDAPRHLRELFSTDGRIADVNPDCARQ